MDTSIGTKTQGPLYDNSHGNQENERDISTFHNESLSQISPEPNLTSLHVRKEDQVTTSIASAPSSTGASSKTGSHSMPSHAHSTAPGGTEQNLDQNLSSNLSNPASANVHKDRFLLEQQIKLTQLQQLQQLQNHIFQQQLALISGQPSATSISPGLTASDFVGMGGIGDTGNIPIDLNAAATLGGVGTIRALQSLHNTQQGLVQSLQHSQQRHDADVGNGTHTFSGLPTPAPSGEILPMDYNTTSTPMMNLIGSLNLQYIEPLPNAIIPSSRSTAHSNTRYGHRHSTSLSSSSVHLQNTHQGHASYPSSPVQAYYIPSSSHSSSHTTPHLSAMNLSQPRIQAQSHPSSLTSTPISAPSSVSERIAFNIYGGNSSRTGGNFHSIPRIRPGNSTNTSPNVLSPGIAGFDHLDLDQDISPLTSPWLGATVAGPTAIATSGPAVSQTIGPVIQKQDVPSSRTTVSGNKRTASDSGDEGAAWSGAGKSRKRPSLGTGGRMGSFNGLIASSAAVTSGLAGGDREKGGEKEGKSGGSMSPRNSTRSPTSEISHGTMVTNLTTDPALRGRSGSDHAPVSRGNKKSSRSTSKTNTPLLRSTTTNLLGPMTPLSPTAANTPCRRTSRVGGSGQGQGQELSSPSPVDLSFEIQDDKCGRDMLPPPVPRSGMDVDMHPTESANSIDDHQHGMLNMGMGFESLMSLDEGMNVGMVGMGMSELEGLGMSGLGGMDISAIGGLVGMEGMGVDIGMNLGGMGGFGSSHEQHQDRGRDDLSIVGMSYGRDHDEEGIRLSAGRANAGNSASHRSEQSPEYLAAQPHLSGTHTQYHQHTRSLSMQHSMHAQPVHHQLEHDQNEFGQHDLGNQSKKQQQPIMPVATPSSMLNLGRLGTSSSGRLGSGLSTSTLASGNLGLGGGPSVVTRGKKAASKATKDAGGLSLTSGSSNRRTSAVGSGTGVGVSPGLKPLRPATSPSESSLPSPALTGTFGISTPKATNSAGLAGLTSRAGSVTATPTLSPTDGIGVIRQPKRTHRDAEQRRRNSQKQVIDELRRLLPPIALPSENSGGNNGDSDIGSSPFFFQPSATSLPGGLPPRGPPKAGGEGPNKNVSKLQVLLCGNEYIKMLKARVERRDREIEMLRREVRRLRMGRGVGDVSEDFLDDRREEGEVDLEKDLDAVERLNLMTGREGSAGGKGAGRDEAMDEDEDEGDE